jgi:hypothetical protein
MVGKDHKDSLLRRGVSFGLRPNFCKMCYFQKLPAFNSVKLVIIQEKRKSFGTRNRHGES